jgi:hypothetical protein
MSRGNEYFLRCTTSIWAGTAKFIGLDKSNRFTRGMGYLRNAETGITATYNDNIVTIRHD